MLKYPFPIQIEFNQLYKLMQPYHFIGKNYPSRFLKHNKYLMISTFDQEDFRSKLLSTYRNFIC